MFASGSLCAPPHLEIACLPNALTPPQSPRITDPLIHFDVICQMVTCGRCRTALGLYSVDDSVVFDRGSVSLAHSRPLASAAGVSLSRTTTVTSLLANIGELSTALGCNRFLVRSSTAGLDGPRHRDNPHLTLHGSFLFLWLMNTSMVVGDDFGPRRAVLCQQRCSSLPRLCRPCRIFPAGTWRHSSLMPSRLLRRSAAPLKRGRCCTAG